MSARDTLTPELRAEVLRLEDDLRARVASLPEVRSGAGVQHMQTGQRRHPVQCVKRSRPVFLAGIDDPD